MELFESKRYKDIYNERIKIVEDSSDNKNLLFTIARSDEDETIRLKAIELIEDETNLYVIAQTDKSKTNRLRAIEKISDQDYLFEIAKTEECKINRLRAIEKISDQVHLFAIAKTELDWYIRLIAIEKITDYNDLFEIALSEYDWFVHLKTQELASLKRIEAPIEKLLLSVRAFNCLKRANINYIKDLINLTTEDLMKVRNMSEESLINIFQQLREIDLSLKNMNNEEKINYNEEFYSGYEEENF